MMVCVIVLSSINFIPNYAIAMDTVEEIVTETSMETATETGAGWYLDNYKLVINKKKVEGSFSQGGTYSDVVSIYDVEGTEMQGMESDIENDIRLDFGRYGNENGKYYCGYSQNISWDSPEDYYAEGTIINLSGITNQEVSHLSWSCRSISARFNVKTIKDTYDYQFVDSSGGNQFKTGADDITVKTSSAIPKAVRGDVAYLLINFNNSTSTDAQAIYTYVWKAPDHPIVAKTYTATAAKKGWYLTDYNFEYAKLYNESKFSDGSLCIDTKTLYDGNGDKATQKSLENDIFVYDERYLGEYITEKFGVGVRYELKWDFPDLYIPAGEYFTISNWSNIVIATTDKWGSPSTHFYAETTGYKTEIVDPKGNSWPSAIGTVSMKSKSVLPEGKDNQKLTAFISIGGIGKAVYTYTWKTGELAIPALTKSKAILYLSGSNKKLTYEIELKNSNGYTVTYKSRKTSVATVSKSGLITAKKAGTANIVVTFKGGGKTISKTIKVEVKAK